MPDEIRIYVADLDAYNNGHLHGVWIDATQELTDIWAEIKTMLADSPVENAEEFAIHDHEGFQGASINEYECMDTVQCIARFINQYPDFGAELLNHYSDIDEAREAAEDNYIGVYTSIADYIQSYTEETTEIPKHLQYYIDYERMGRDVEMSGDIFTIETSHQEVHIFWSR